MFGYVIVDITKNTKVKMIFRNNQMIEENKAEQEGLEPGTVTCRECHLKTFSKKCKRPEHINVYTYLGVTKTIPDDSVKHCV